jgi:hypothetical protein
MRGPYVLKMRRILASTPQERRASLSSVGGELAA